MMFSLRMLFETTADATTLGYWLNWRVLICAIWVFASFTLAIWMIWEYEIKDRLGHSTQETQQDKNKLRSFEAWRPCLRQIHPIWMLAFRVCAFSSMLASLIVKTLANGASTFYYYTQWTFTLLTIYFACGSVISIYGVFICNRKRTEGLNEHLNENDMEEGQHVPLLSGKPSNLIGGNIVSYSKEQRFSPADIWSYIFEVLFQINAGAVVLTDCTYWFVIFPFLTIKDYNFSFMTTNMHTLNLALLLGETALNSLTLPRFRISFFFLWTGIYVIFQWIIHAVVSIGWPYPFLDLSAPYAPLWYVLMGLIHIPSYGVFMLIIKLKHELMMKWFPQSYQW
ncbi:uncharacterized protein LOC111441456 isoform X1 [Cucurbita moschata]|uniref:Uncharacterized protein LOC111441456 isoform X1 n=1 Tax=Cucurbita moschata TaxID=3662 RepID=A0A6J1F724_CUCMO|nr:uncharacterized protein LOC111441456 isoform X1 [Cucurbita moschata]